MEDSPLYLNREGATLAADRRRVYIINGVMVRLRNAASVKGLGATKKKRTCAAYLTLKS